MGHDVSAFLSVEFTAPLNSIQHPADCPVRETSGAMACDTNGTAAVFRPATGFMGFVGCMEQSLNAPRETAKTLAESPRVTAVPFVTVPQLSQ